MSIYVTLWRLQFPRHGDDHTGCEWVEVLAQGVPAHIGNPTPGLGYESGDPYAIFLPPALTVYSDEDSVLRAVVFVRKGTPKGTQRSGQEYANPLLLLTGEEYASLSFGDLHEKICDALRSGRPRLIAETWSSEGRGELHFEDRSSKPVKPGAGTPE